MNGTSPINANVWQDLLELEAATEPGMLQQMVATYLGEASQILAALPALARENGGKPMRSAAHKLKSSSASMGALVLAQLLLELEKSEGLSTETITKLMTRTGEEFERVRSYLEKMGQGRDAA